MSSISCQCGTPIDITGQEWKYREKPAFSFDQKCVRRSAKCEDFKDEELYCPGMHIRKVLLPPCCRPRRGFNGFIANNCGHLYPWIRKDPQTSPWGDFPAWEWDRNKACDCLPCRPCRGRPRPCHRNKFSKLPKFFCESPRVICTSDEDEFIEDVDTRKARCNVFFPLKALKIPVIWIYGFPDENYALRRENFGIELSRFLKFTYINMEEEMSHFLRAGVSIGDDVNDLEVQRQAAILVAARRNMLARSLETQTKFKGLIPDGSGSFEAGQLSWGYRMAKRLEESPGEGLNPKGVIELLKLIMIMYFPTNGFVIDSFPIGEEEAVLFENEINPIAAGIYFQTNKWTANKSKEPNFRGHPHFRRDLEYSERELESFIDSGRFRSRTIRILNCDDTVELKEEAIYRGIGRFLDQYAEKLKEVGPESMARKNIKSLLIELESRAHYSPDGGWILEPGRGYAGVDDDDEKEFNSEGAFEIGEEDLEFNEDESGWGSSGVDVSTFGLGSVSGSMSEPGDNFEGSGSYLDEQEDYDDPDSSGFSPKESFSRGKTSNASVVGSRTSDVNFGGGSGSDLASDAPKGRDRSGSIAPSRGRSGSVAPSRGRSGSVAPRTMSMNNDISVSFFSDEGGSSEGRSGSKSSTGKANKKKKSFV